DLNLAEKCLHKAVELSTKKNIALHSLGNFYERQKRDLLGAKMFYEICVDLPVGNFGAELDLLRIKRQMNHSFDPVEDFHRILERYQVPGKIIHTYLQMGHFYYFEQSDLENAEKYYRKAISYNPESANLKVRVNC